MEDPDQRRLEVAIEERQPIFKHFKRQVVLSDLIEGGFASSYVRAKSIDGTLPVEDEIRLYHRREGKLVEISERSTIINDLINVVGPGSGGTPGDIVGGSMFRSATWTTTDAQVRTLDTIAVPNNKVILITADVIAKKSDMSAHAGFKLVASYRNNGGTVSIQGSVGYPHMARSGGWKVTLKRSGTNALLQVKGVASTTITWTSLVMAFQA